MSTHTTWGIRAGRSGEAHAQFLSQNVIGVGWLLMGDLSGIPAKREAFKVAVAKAFPDEKPNSIPNQAGQLYRFLHEMKNGDLVVYPSKVDRLIHLGRVKGDYVYDGKSEVYPNVRAVEWLKAVPRVKFSQGALYEIGSAMTFFQVKTYADEFRAAIHGNPPAAPVSVAEDPTAPEIQGDIEDNTRDYIIKKLAQDLKGHPLAEFVAHLLRAMGFRTRLSPPGTDGGVDIIAHKDELGIEPPVIKTQVKSAETGSIGDPTVAALYGKVDPKEFGLFVTLGTYTNQAKQFARGRSNLRLIDGDELVNLILAHYEQFDSRYKSILPLKRIYVPDRENASAE